MKTPRRRLPLDRVSGSEGAFFANGLQAFEWANAETSKRERSVCESKSGCYLMLNEVFTDAYL